MIFCNCSVFPFYIIKFYPSSTCLNNLTESKTPTWKGRSLNSIPPFWTELNGSWVNCVTSIQWFMYLFTKLNHISNYDEVILKSNLNQNDIQKILGVHSVLHKSVWDSLFCVLWLGHRVSETEPDFLSTQQQRKIKFRLQLGWQFAQYFHTYTICLLHSLHYSCSVDTPFIQDTFY